MLVVDLSYLRSVSSRYLKSEMIRQKGQQVYPVIESYRLSVESMSDYSGGNVLQLFGC